MKKYFPLFFLLFLPLSASAQAFCSGEIGSCISKFYVWAIAGAALLALIMLIFGGYRVMTAGGNAQQAGDGKSYITSSLIGLALLLGAYLLLNTINPDLVNFHLDFSQLQPQPSSPNPTNP